MLQSSYPSPVRKSFALWVLFVVYIIVAGITILHHEPWGDELHSWNIAKGSNSFLDLINNTRYEGHPPVWYVVLWLITRFSHNLVYLQAAQFILIVIAIYLLLFHSPLPYLFKLLIPFGYYFIFEYAVLSRNYAVGIVCCFIICAIIKKRFKYKTAIYYLFLFLMSNTHLLAALLAASIHIYFLLQLVETKKKSTLVISHLVLGIFILLPALYFVLPPSDGEMNSSFWVNRWSINQLVVTAQIPLRAFMPIAAWWKQDFWNTQFLLEMSGHYTFLKFVYPFISAGLILLVLYVLRNNRKVCILFIANLILSGIICCIFPLSGARYVGYIFISFIVSCWLYYYETPIPEFRMKIIAGLFCMQIIAGLYAVVQDISRPFSKLYAIDSLLKEVPSNQQVVTDYWALNAVSAYTKQGMYCIDLRKKVSFILWGSDMKALNENPYRYYSGTEVLFTQQNIKQVYMISTGSPDALKNIDPLFFNRYTVQLIDKRTGAIEKGSNLYLYRISKFQ